MGDVPIKPVARGRLRQRAAGQQPFNYAPVVRWTGYDPDGMIQAYQYHDDSTQAAVDAYNAGNGRA